MSEFFKPGDWICYREPPFRIGRWKLPHRFGIGGGVEWCDSPGTIEYGGREIMKVDVVTALALLEKET